MATEPSAPGRIDGRRRACLRAALAAALLPARTTLRAATHAPGAAVRTAASALRLAAAWQTDSHAARLGVLAARDAALAVDTALELPGRAHGLLQDGQGRVLAVARRPGDWLLRWDPLGSGAEQWRWIEPDRAFTGHVLASADGRRLYTPETDLANGQGLIGVRDAASLEKLAEWPTHGLDPHALLLDDGGDLVVANGGIATRPETGRRKLAAGRIDASLVRLAARDGALLGQWRLPDACLSMRHLAWARRPAGQPMLLGIALQAEHEDTAVRAAAPTLALFDGSTLRLAEPGHAAADAVPLAGYGGDIAAFGDGFAVSCPRAAGGGVAWWNAAGGWLGFVPLAEACALASAPVSTPGATPALWFGGRHAALAHDGHRPQPACALPGLALDNHWVALA